MAEASGPRVPTGVMLMETLRSLMMGWANPADGLMFFRGKFPQMVQVFVFCST